MPARVILLLAALCPTAAAAPPAAVRSNPARGFVAAPSADGDAAPAALDIRPAERVRANAAPRRTAGASSLTLDFVSVGVPPEGDSPTELVFSADDSIFVISHRDSHNLVVFDADTRSVLGTIDVSGTPNSLALSSDGVHAVTANLFENTVSIIDLTTGMETATVSVGAQPGVVRITPDGTTAVVGNTLDSDLSVVDIASATELGRIPGAGFAQITSLGAFATAVRFTDYVIAPDNQTVVFPDMFAGQIVFFDLSGLTSSPVASQPNPFGIDLSPDGSTAVVAHSFPESRLSVVDVGTKTITKTIAVGGSATFVPPVAMNPAKTRAVVAVTNNVRVVDLVSNAVSADLFTGAVNFLRTAAGGQYCASGDFQGSVVDFTASAVVATLLNSTTPDWLGVSPQVPRAATAHILRKEFSEVMSVDGALGFLEGIVPTGPAPEGDKARAVAVTPDASRAVVINNHSHNATIIELDSLSVQAAVNVGQRPGAVAVTPDGTTAVVANLDSTFASIIDLAAASATAVTISTRGSQVAISPDGQYAYVSVLADGDGRINLNTLAVAGARILTGNMGSIGFVFEQSSGMRLSHDGGTLVTCGSFTNDVSIIDTAAWIEVARVPVGAFPVRAVFSPDDSTIYISNKDDGSVSVLTNAGASSGVIDTIVVGSQPWELAVHPLGDRLYVANFMDRSIAVVDLDASVVSTSILIPQTDGAGEPVGMNISADGARLFVAANGADFHVIDTASESITDTLNTGLAPIMMAYHDEAGCAYIPSPLGPDGLSVVCLPAPPCAALADCADLDSNGIRDDNCVWWACTDQTCAGTEIVFADMGGQFGSCPPDGAADGNDRFQALNCFSNIDTAGAAGFPCEAAPPLALNVDAGGPFGDCAPDGVCDGNDAFHALNAFQGTSACSCPQEPSPGLPSTKRRAR
jgi:YVTN family beta-propeller protein